MKRKTENPHRQLAGFLFFRNQALQLFRCHHTLERIRQRRQCNGQLDVVKQPAQISQCVGDALQKVLFALVEPAKAISAQRLHNAYVNVSVVKLHEFCAIKIDQTSQAVEIVIEQLLPQLGGRSALASYKREAMSYCSALCVRLDSRGKTADYLAHDVAGLKITIEKIIAAGAQEEFRQPTEIVFEGLLVEGNTGKP